MDGSDRPSARQDAAEPRTPTSLQVLAFAKHRSRADAPSSWSSRAKRANTIPGDRANACPTAAAATAGARGGAAPRIGSAPLYTRNKSSASALAAPGSESEALPARWSSRSALDGVMPLPVDEVGRFRDPSGDSSIPVRGYDSRTSIETSSGAYSPLRRNNKLPDLGRTDDKDPDDPSTLAPARAMRSDVDDVFLRMPRRSIGPGTSTPPAYALDRLATCAGLDLFPVPAITRSDELTSITIRGIERRNRLAADTSSSYTLPSPDASKRVVVEAA